jgi:subtilisin family serine protease
LTSLQTREIDIKSSAKAKSQNLNQTTKATKQVFSKIDGIKHYFLTVKLDSESSFGRLKRHALTAQSLLFKVKGQTDYRKFPSNKLLGDILPNLYDIDPHCEFDDLVNMAKELEKLDYVVYCTVSPDLKELAPPDLPLPMPLLPVKDNVDANSDTPHFVDLQTYLRESSTVESIYGMNVLAAFARMRYGQGATVRLWDGGIHSDHEDLKGNMTVLGIGEGLNARDHGTASAGCIAAINEGDEGLPRTGVVGIACRSDFSFYSYDYLTQLAVDSVPGDIVAINAQWYEDGKFIPLIHGRREWDLVKALTDNGVTVILAAGNGHLDLSEAAGHINQFGDSGSMLVGACRPDEGRKAAGFSNYGHSTSLINSWGSGVVTSGYGDLQKMPGNDRNYTAGFSGTSSATPLSAGALASIQGYCISQSGAYIGPYLMRDILKSTGYTEALKDGIGHRPDVWGAMKYLDGNFG